jgi:hypothetical protein
MTFKAAWLATACSLVFAAGAHAASTNFANIGAQYPYDGAAGYSDGGITLKYVGTPASIWTTSLPSVGSGYSWYVAGSTGYTDISLTGGGSFTDASLLVGTGYGGASPRLAYAFVSNGTVLATGDWGALQNFGDGLVTANLSSATPITDLWVQGTAFQFGFDAGNLDALSIAQVTIPTSVPEPANMVLLLSGLGLLGVAAARRKRG